MDSATISLLITGGTFDKDYETTSGKLVFSKTHLPEVLQQANCTLNINSQMLMLKDSLEMSTQDREIILQAVLQSKAQKIVITHGTDTMVETAQYLLNEPNLQDRTIVLTGAMRPYKLGNSDASFNLASALMAVQLAAPDVYISMNGHLFQANEVVKNRPRGVFEAI